MFLSKRMLVLLLAVVLLAGLGVSRWALVGPNKAEASEKAGGESRKAVEEERSETRALAPQRPIGNWERQFGPLQVSLHVKADRLTGIIDLPSEKCRLNLVFDADYNVTRDGVLYGVLTGVDCQGSGVVGEFKELAEIQAVTNRLIDQPFSIRYRVDDGVLTIKEVKFGTIGLKDDKDELADMKAMAIGRYHQAGAGGKERTWCIPRTGCGATCVPSAPAPSYGPTAASEPRPVQSTSR